MIRVVPRKGEKIQQTLRRFKKIVEREGIVKEMKKLVYYESPSEIRNRNKRRVKKEIEKEARIQKKEQNGR